MPSSGMHGIGIGTGTEKVGIELRARRLAWAWVSGHAELDALERDRVQGPGVSALRHDLHERAQDLATMTELLPRTHPLRLASEQVLRAVEEWAAQPLGTEDARAGSLSMVIAASYLRRTLEERERALAA